MRTSLVVTPASLVASVTLAAFASLSSLACGGSSPDPAAPVSGGGTSATPAAATAKPGAPSAADDAATKAAALEKMTQEEAKSGSCDGDHKAAVEKLLTDVENGMKTKTGDDGKPLGLTVVGKRVLALGPNARGVEMTVTGKGTEVHVLAYGAKEISMDVLAGTTAATTLRSPHQRTAAGSMSLDVAKVGPVTEIQSDSRQVTIKPGQPIEVKLTGQGCAGLITFVKP